MPWVITCGIIIPLSLHTVKIRKIMDKNHYRKLEDMYHSAACNEYYSPKLTVSKGKAEIVIPIRKDFFHAAGQVGADQAALDAAIKYNFPYGGWIQKGRKNEDGILPYEYKLKELKSGAHPNYTERNVINSDGTLIISHGKLKGGSVLPRRLAKEHNRPCFHIDLNETPTFIAASKINSWISISNLYEMNVGL